MKPGDILEFELEKAADRGKSLARLDGYVVFVEGGVPGDYVRVRLGRRKKKYAEARLLEVLRPSPLRTAPRCEYFGVCGGCKWQHFAYAAQLEAKRESVRDAFAHAGGFRDVDVAPTIGSEHVYFYRNKMEFSFSAQRWLTREEIESGQPFETDFALGLHAPGSFAKVLDLHACYLQSELSVRLVNAVRLLAQAEGWSAWNTYEHTGYLRHLVIRQSAHLPEVMVNLVTSGWEPERAGVLAAFLEAHFPEVSTFVNTINSSLAQTAFGEETRVVFGPGVIHDRIGRFTFEIAPSAFFQTNTRQAERLYDAVLAYADLRPTDRVYDLYCGAGTISLYMAPYAREVLGVELVEAAVENARANAAANGIGNCTFVAGDLMRLFTPEFVARHGAPDVLVVDPPRAGMHPRVAEQIARLRPRRLVYVSCNPQTQARDLALLGEGYRLEAVQPVDLFPHTFHIESVARLSAR